MFNAFSKAYAKLPEVGKMRWSFVGLLLVNRLAIRKMDYSIEVAAKLLYALIKNTEYAAEEWYANAEKKETEKSKIQ